MNRGGWGDSWVWGVHGLGSVLRFDGLDEGDLTISVAELELVCLIRIFIDLCHFVLDFLTSVVHYWI